MPRGIPISPERQQGIVDFLMAWIMRAADIHAGTPRNLAREGLSPPTSEEGHYGVPDIYEDGGDGTDGAFDSLMADEDDGGDR